MRQTGRKRAASTSSPCAASISANVVSPARSAARIRGVLSGRGAVPCAQSTPVSSNSSRAAATISVRSAAAMPAGAASGTAASPASSTPPGNAQ
jgi:hypothetical protein